jgi:enoyl-CoA hydratase/carnithine racemase
VKISKKLAQWLIEVEQDLLTKRQDGTVFYLTLNHPESGNSLSRAMIAELYNTLDELAVNSGINVIVISGIGVRVFCAGHDLENSMPMRIQSFILLFYQNIAP